MADSVSLYELNALVREVLEDAMPMSYWVRAELSECRESRGHCYLELIQKDETSNTPVARASAKCWRNVWTGVRMRFERVAGQPLRAGLQVMLLVHAQFHEAYGFSWIVDDINPEFTLGDMERKRREIVSRLKAEGVFDLNRELSLPLLVQRVAVISSQTAAGYGDFWHQLNDNSHNLQFHAELFPAIMQGEQVEQSVIAALEAIYERVDEFDVVVIIRGGGATADMSGFDTLALAENVAQFPLPVITGIGHDRDECVLDMVANTRVKTPTAAAALLVEHQYGVLCVVDDCCERVVRQAHSHLQASRECVQQLSAALPLYFSRCIRRHEHQLERLMTEVVMSVHRAVAQRRHRVESMEVQVPMVALQAIKKQQHKLEILAMRVQAADPQRILDRGYSLTLHQGHVVREAKNLSDGDVIETRVAQGSFTAVVRKNADRAECEKSK